MPQSKKLQKKIEKKLEALQELIDEINEVQNLNSDDPDTWDSDTLYNLVESLKEALQLLEDKEIKPYLTKTYRSYQEAKKQGNELEFIFLNEDEA